MTRRQFLVGSVAIAAFRNSTLGAIERLLKYDGAPDDEEYWLQIRNAFQINENLIMFNSGGVSPSPRVVAEAIKREMDLANMGPSFYMWGAEDPEIESLRVRMAKAFGGDPEELAITRNATEALENCLLGIDLKAGDEVLTTSQDYPEMISVLKQRVAREGVKLITVTVPSMPKTQSELSDAIIGAITDKTKLILVCHMTWGNGQIYPVAGVCAEGKKRGIPVVVDGAHAWAHIPYRVEDTNAEMYCASLHKWFMGPIGTGLLYVKKDRIKDVWPMMPPKNHQATNIRKFEEIGTHPDYVFNALGEALTFHEMIGTERKAARFRYLRKRWTDRVTAVSKIKMLTNLAPEHSCGITTVGIDGIDPGALMGWLLNRHAIFTRAMPDAGLAGIRVTPSVYSRAADVDRFADALIEAATKGLE